MALISIPYTFSVGAVIIAAQHNSNFSTIYNDYNGNVTDANIAANAAIDYTKLNLFGTIKNTDLNSTTIISATNLPVGTAVGDIVQLVAGTTASLPAVNGSLLTGLNYGLADILNYGTSASASTPVAQNALKIAYGTISVGTSATVNITNLPFTSGSTYVVLLGWLGDTRISQQYPLSIAYINGGSFSISSQQGTYTQTVSWMAIGT